MYNSFFGLQQLPFENAPNPAQFVNLPAHDEALEALRTAIDQRKGLVLLTGGPGTGKTLTTRIIKQRCGANAAVAVISRPCSNAHDLLLAIAEGFRLRRTNSDTAASLSREIERFAQKLYEQDVPAVVIADSAHDLPDDCFNAIRHLADLEADDMPLLQIVLVGWPKTRARFLGLSGAAMQQRIYRHVELRPMTRDETAEYVAGRLQMAGRAERNLFADAAITVVHERTGGIPRLVNLLCDAVLTCAANQGAGVVGDELVRGTPFEQSYDPQVYEAQLAGDEGYQILQAQLERHPVIRAMMERIEAMAGRLEETTTCADETRTQQDVIGRSLRRYDRLMDRVVPMLRSLRQFRQDSQTILANCTSACRQLESMLEQPASTLNESQALATQLQDVSQDVRSMMSEIDQARNAIHEQLDESRRTTDALAEQVKASAPSLEQTRNLVGVLQKIHNLTRERCKELTELNQQAMEISQSIPAKVAEVEQILREPSLTLERLRIVDGILRKRIEAGESLIERTDGAMRELRDAAETNRELERISPMLYEDFGRTEPQRKPPVTVLGNSEPQSLARRVQELQNLVQGMRRNAGDVSVASR